MSYDVFLQAFRNGGAGEGDREGALRVILALGDRAQRHRSGFDITTADGGAAELYGSGLVDDKVFSGCMIAIRGGFSRGLAEFIYDLGHKGNLVLIAPSEDSVLACTRAEQMADVTALSDMDDWRKEVVAGGDEVHALLTGGYAEWLKFAEKVRKQNEEEGKRTRRAKRKDPRH